MHKVKVYRNELLEVLQKNRDAHRDIFERALIGYRKAVIEVLEKRLDEARSNKKVGTYINLREPIDQTSDYNKAIRMMEMSVDDKIELTETEFSNYVLDDWSWSAKVSDTNMAYTQ